MIWAYSLTASGPGLLAIIQRRICSKAHQNILQDVVRLAVMVGDAAEQRPSLSKGKQDVSLGRVLFYTGILLHL